MSIVPQAALDWLATVRAEHCSPLSYHAQYRCTLSLLCDSTLQVTESPSFTAVEKIDPRVWLEEHNTSPQYRNATVLLRQELLVDLALCCSWMSRYPLLACVSSTDTPLPIDDSQLRKPLIKAEFDGQHYVAVLPRFPDDPQPRYDAAAHSAHPLTKSQRQLQFVWASTPLKEAVWSFLRGWLKHAFPDKTDEIFRLLSDGVAANHPDYHIYDSMHDLLCRANQEKLAARSISSASSIDSSKGSSSADSSSDSSTDSSSTTDSSPSIDSSKDSSSTPSSDSSSTSSSSDSSSSSSAIDSSSDSSSTDSSSSIDSSKGSSISSSDSSSSSTTDSTDSSSSDSSSSTTDSTDSSSSSSTDSSSSDSSSSDSSSSAIDSSTSSSSDSSSSSSTDSSSSDSSSSQTSSDRSSSSSSSSSQSSTTSRPSSYRTNLRTRDIQQLLDRVNVKSARSILDFGCAEGSITAALGQLLQVPAANTHGCDVRDIANATDFTFSKAIEDQPLPYSDGQFSVAFVLMVLHHIPTYEQSVKELLRVIELGGLLVVREHDCVPDDFAVVLDIVHALYALVLRGEVEDPTFLDTYWAVYRPRQTWIDCIESVRLDDQSGLLCVHQSPTTGPQQTFFAVFRKVSAEDLSRPRQKRPDVDRRLDQPLSQPKRGRYGQRGHHDYRNQRNHHDYRNFRDYHDQRDHRDHRGQRGRYR